LLFLVVTSQALLNCEKLRFVVPVERGEPENPMILTKRKRKRPTRAKALLFDSLVSRYYPAVYSFACRFTDNPREAVALAREAFKSTQKQLQTLRDEDALATILISAVIRAGVATA
jgi:hypothetical protein